MNRIVVRIAAALMLALAIAALVRPQAVYASDAADAAVVMSDEASNIHSKAWAAGITIAVVAAAGAISMGLVILKSVEGIARQPEAEGKIRTTMMLGLVFVETAIIYALIMAILIIFVL